MQVCTHTSNTWTGTGVGSLATPKLSTAQADAKNSACLPFPGALKLTEHSQRSIQGLHARKGGGVTELQQVAALLATSA